MPSRSVHHALAALCLAGAFALFCLPVANPDLFWHLSAGKWIVSHLAFPRADWLSSTMQGRPWVDFEWLPQVAYFAIWKAAGMTGLWALKVALFCASAGALWHVLGLYGARSWHKAFAVLFWSLAVSYACDLRPENLSLAFFLIVVRRLERIRLTGRRPRRATLAWLALLFATWANIHAGFLCGLGLIALYVVVHGLKKKDWALAPMLGVCALASVLNPYGMKVYAVALAHGAELGPLNTYIGEWRVSSPLNLWQWPFWAALAGSLGLAAWQRLKRKDMPAEHLAALALFGAAGAFYARAAVYFLCIAVPFVAAALSRWRLTELRPRLATGLLVGGITSCCCLVAFAGARGGIRTGIFDEGFIPTGAAAFLEEQSDAMAGRRLFNPWHWGGYLGWRLYPDFQVFADGRYLFHPLLRPMYQAARSPKDYAAFLDGCGIEVAAIERSPQVKLMPVELGRSRTGQALRPFYLEYYPEKRWALVYWDAKSLVFARRDAFAKAWLAEQEYRLFRPDDFQALGMRLNFGVVKQSDLKKEAERFSARHPELVNK